MPDTLFVGSVFSVQLDPEGDLWYGTPFGGLQQVDGQTLAVSPWNQSSYWAGPVEDTSSRHLIITPASLLIWHDNTLSRSPFIFPSLSPIQDIHFEAVPSNELPEVNTQTRREFYINNTGEGTLKISNISSTGSMFRFQTEQFTTPSNTTFDFTLNKGRIPSGDSLRVAVVYLPTEPGQHILSPGLGAGFCWWEVVC